MSFQILDKDNNPISINELDRQAAEFWNKEVKKECYAFPQIKPKKFESYKEAFSFWSSVTNWYDNIGWYIHEGYTNWKDLYNKLLEPYKEGLENGDYTIEEILNYPGIGGYLNLIKYWESKGYTPKQIKD